MSFSRVGRKDPFSPWGEGARRADEGACAQREATVAPHQFGQMTYGRAVKVEIIGKRVKRDRKSWPHVLSPKGRGGTASLDHRPLVRKTEWRSSQRRTARLPGAAEPLLL